jgi:DNA-3-methyladenine glycosylase II
MRIGLLHPLPPYDFARSIAAAQYHSVLDVTRDDAYWRALDCDGHIALVRVTSQGTLDRPALIVERMAATGAVDDARLLARVAHLLGVGADLRPFYAAAQAAPELWRVVRPLYGLRHVRAAALFEALLTTIIEQQISLRQAQKGERWLAQWAGGRIDYQGHTFHTFPAPGRIAAASQQDLTPLKITFRRMQLMIDIARQVAGGQLDLQTLARQQPPVVYSALLAHRGIGQWTAGWTIIRALGHYQYVGENDVALQAAVNHYFHGQSGRAAPDVVAATLGRYGEHAGAAAFFTLMRWGFDRY